MVLSMAVLCGARTARDWVGVGGMIPLFIQPVFIEGLLGAGHHTTCQRNRGGQETVPALQMLRVQVEILTSERGNFNKEQSE